jgi:hypothetical protein
VYVIVVPLLVWGGRQNGHGMCVWGGVRWGVLHLMKYDSGEERMSGWGGGEKGGNSGKGFYARLLSRLVFVAK